MRKPKLNTYDVLEPCDRIAIGTIRGETVWDALRRDAEHVEFLLREYDISSVHSLDFALVQSD